MVDQPISGAIVRVDAALSHHLRLDGLGQLFAQLHSPLVVGVDIPDNALGEDLHLVHREERAQGEGGHSVHHDAVSRPIPSELLVGSDTGDVCL